MSDFFLEPWLHLDFSVEHFNMYNIPNLGWGGGTFNSVGANTYMTHYPDLHGGVLLIDSTSNSNGGYWSTTIKNTNGVKDMSFCLGFAFKDKSFGDGTAYATLFAPENYYIYASCRGGWLYMSQYHYVSLTSLSNETFYILFVSGSYQNGEFRAKLIEASSGTVIYNTNQPYTTYFAGLPFNRGSNNNLTLNAAYWDTASTMASAYYGHMTMWEAGMSESDMDAILPYYINKYKDTSVASGGGGGGGGSANCTIIRYEGTNTTSGTPGSSNTIWELYIFTNGIVEIHFSSYNGSTGGLSGVFTSNGTGNSTTSWPSSGYTYLINLANAPSSSTNLTYNMQWRGGNYTSQIYYPDMAAGNAPTSSYPSGWTGMVNSSTDDGFQAVPLVSGTSLFGSTQSYAYVGSNGYITFGGGATQYSGITSTSPAYDKICINAADRSYQMLYYKHATL